jgi:hypothetical protein
MEKLAILLIFSVFLMGSSELEGLEDMEMEELELGEVVKKGTLLYETIHFKLA